MDYVLDPTFANYDIGVCQINKLWLKKMGLDNEDLLDRETNINVAAKIYLNNVRRCKNNIYCALSLYNTGKKNSKIGKKYANKVLKARKKLFNK
jgi:soluble lytic murein transglycosylase-like protein